MIKTKKELSEQFMYCSFCGGFLEYEGNNLMVCSSCMKHMYINPKPTNAVILQNNKGEILLVKRKTDPAIGMWDLPGGFIDMNENVEESLVREIHEELGINLSHIQYFASYADLYEYQGIDYPTVGFVYTARIKDGNIIPTDDITEAKFFASNSIPFDKLAFKSLEKALRKLLKN